MGGRHQEQCGLWSQAYKVKRFLKQELHENTLVPLLFGHIKQLDKDCRQHTLVGHQYALLASIAECLFELGLSRAPLTTSTMSPETARRGPSPQRRGGAHRTRRTYISGIVQTWTTSKSSDKPKQPAE